MKKYVPVIAVGLGTICLSGASWSAAQAIQEQRLLQTQYREAERWVEELLADEQTLNRFLKHHRIKTASEVALRQYLMGFKLLDMNSVYDGSTAPASRQARLNGLEASIRHLRRATELDPEFAAAYVTLGDIFYEFSIEREGNRRERNQAEALRMYRQSFTLDSENVEARYKYASVSSDMREKIEQLKQVLRLDPEHDYAHGALTDVYRFLGETEKAIAEYKEQIRVFPGYWHTFKRLADLLVQKGRVEEVKWVYQKYAEVHPDAIGRIIGGPGSKSSNTLLELEEKYGLTGVSELIEEMGRMALFETGRTDMAIYAFRVLVKREPERVEAVMSYLQEYRRRKGRRDEAVLCRACPEQGPHMPLKNR